MAVSKWPKRQSRHVVELEAPVEEEKLPLGQAPEQELAPVEASKRPPGVGRGGSKKKRLISW